MTANMAAQIPDIGGRIAFVSNRDGMQNIWVMELKTGLTYKITNFPDTSGINGVSYPRWSPDGRYVAFEGGRGRVPEYCSGEIFIVIANPNDPEYGIVRQVTSFPDNYLEAALPSWDPSNSNVLYYAEWRWASYGKIHRVNIESGIDETIPDLIGSRVEWFDVTTDGTRLLFSKNYQYYGFQDVSANGSYTLFPLFNDSNRKWIGRINRTDDWILYHQLSGSSDPANIFKVNPLGDYTTIVKLTYGTGSEENYWPVWTKGGNAEYVLFQTNRYGNEEIALIRADGLSYPNGIINLTNDPASDLIPDWTPTENNESPAASAGPDKTLHIGELAIFDGAASSDSDGTIVSYIWDFGDGETGSGFRVEHLYKSKGIFAVTLTVTDNYGAIGSDTTTVEVINSAPVANAGPDQIIEGVGLATSFTLNGLGSVDPDGDALIYSWADATSNVGEGEIVTLSRALGNYAFTLTVTDPEGLSSSDFVNISIRDTTPPAITAPANLTVNELDPTGTPVNIGQPTVSDNCDPNPTIVNDAPALFTVGIRTVTWRATDSAGNTAVAQQTVTVIPGPPLNQLDNLAEYIQYQVLAGTIEEEIVTSLLAKVYAARDALLQGNPNAAKVAMSELKALVNQVEAQTDKKILPAAADEIIARANQIILALGG